MTSNSDFHKDFGQLSGDDSAAELRSVLSHQSDLPDMLKRDRFELLSAYLDGEVTAIERRQVEDWLATDPTAQRLYDRLLKLRQGFRNLSVPQSEKSAEQTVEEVFARIDRRPKLTVLWGGAGAAAAALLVGVMTGVFSGVQSPTNQAPSVAEQPKVAPEVMKIALDRPVVNIPKTAVADPMNTKPVFASPHQSGNPN